MQPRAALAAASPSVKRGAIEMLVAENTVKWAKRPGAHGSIGMPGASSPVWPAKQPAFPYGNGRKWQAARSAAEARGMPCSAAEHVRIKASSSPLACGWHRGRIARRAAAARPLGMAAWRSGEIGHGAARCGVRSAAAIKPLAAKAAGMERSQKARNANEGMSKRAHAALKRKLAARRPGGPAAIVICNIMAAVHVA